MIDTHAHIFLPDFEGDRTAMLQRAAESGVTDILMPCINAASLDQMDFECSLPLPRLHKTVGLHPTDVDNDYKDTLYILRTAITTDTKAIGEIGLDYYWDTEYKPQQLHALAMQLEWAQSMALPVMLHCRGEGAFEDILTTLPTDGSNAGSGVFHCFGGTHRDAERILSLNDFYFGIGGVVTYKKSTLPQVLRDLVPLDRIVLETDSPYLSPSPHRGKRNEPANLLHIAAKLSEIYQVSLQRIDEITTLNARKLFAL